MQRQNDRNYAACSPLRALGRPPIVFISRHWAVSASPPAAFAAHRL